MKYIQPELEIITTHLKKVKSTDKPIWGEMSAQRMVEHLSDAVTLSRGNHNLPLEIKEEHTPKAQAFLISEHPLPKLFKASFATPDIPERNSSMDEAILEFEKAWKLFIADFTSSPTKCSLHPNFGKLDFDLWKRMHSKHITHHLEQFGVICQ